MSFAQLKNLPFYNFNEKKNAPLWGKQNNLISGRTSGLMWKYVEIPYTKVTTIRWFQQQSCGLCYRLRLCMTTDKRAHVMLDVCLRHAEKPQAQNQQRAFYLPFHFCIRLAFFLFFSSTKYFLPFSTNNFFYINAWYVLSAHLKDCGLYTSAAQRECNGVICFSQATNRHSHQLVRQRSMYRKEFDSKCENVWNWCIDRFQSLIKQ